VQLKPHAPENGLEALLRQEFWRELQDWGLAHRAVRDRAFAQFSERGGYPMAQARSDVPWPEVADQLNETVIQRAIQRDLRMGQRGQKRDAQLLEEVYRLVCRYAGQSPGQAVFTQEIKQALAGDASCSTCASWTALCCSSWFVRWNSGSSAGRVTINFASVTTD
jgi:hypothetical protein